MIKLFVSDLDGTLLGMDHYIKNEDVDAIKRIVDRDVPFTVASGRMDHEIKEVLKRIGVGGHRVSQNGAFVFNHSDDQIHAKTFDGNLAAKVMKAMEDEPMIKTVSTSNKTYTAEDSKWINKISEQLFHKIIIEPAMINHFGTSIIPSKITLHGKEQDVIDAYNRINQSFGEEIDCFISHETCVDLMPKAVNKGEGLKALIATLGIEPEELACIGDSFNDLAMFNITPHSYAMASAHEEVKANATHIVDHVHEAIEDLEKKGLL